MQGSRLTVWVRRTDVAGAQYVAVRNVDASCSVDELKVLWASGKSPRVDPELVALHLAKCGPGKPNTTEESAALQPGRLIDDPRLTLTEAGIADGSSLLAVVIAAVQRSGSSPGSDRSGSGSLEKRDDAYMLLLPFLSEPLDDKMRRAFTTERAFQSQRKLLKSGLFKRVDVARLLNGLKNFVCTTTRHLLVSETGLVLDGPVPGSSSGQGSTSVRFALAGSAVYVAKIGPPRLLESEFAASEAVAAAGNFPTVMRIFRKVPLPHFSDGGAARAALLMPAYAMSLFDAALSLPPGKSYARDILALNVALCGAGAVAAFAAGGFAHGDIKTGNFMLDGSGLVIAIDFGTALPVGESFVEGSRFGLDALGIAGISYDVTCLGSTLWSLQEDCPLPPHSTRASLLDAIAASYKTPGCRPPAAAVAEYCLAKTAEVSLASLRELLVELLDTDSGKGLWREQFGVVNLDVVWPK